MVIVLDLVEKLMFCGFDIIFCKVEVSFVFLDLFVVLEFVVNFVIFK